VKKNNYYPKNYDVWECENIFYLKSDLPRINKFLSRYELYKKIKNLPGCLIECGVYKGSSLMQWAHFRKVLEKKETRKIHAFDSFGFFPKKGIKNFDDKKFIERFPYDDGGGVGISQATLKKMINLKKFSNINLIKGNIFNTLKKFIKKNKNIKIALLHLDLDVYEPTSYTLNFLYKYMIKGGLIILDDYSTVKGATRAADEFIKKNKLKIKRVKFNKTPFYIKI
tara:strand:+ start:175 stop:849 length:675 start_codon:yes stop_codon:yes gene_type:complete